MIGGKTFSRTVGVLFSIGALFFFAEIPAQGVLTVVGDSLTVASRPGDPVTGSIEIYFDTSDGASVSVGNYQISIGLTGPGAGSNVKIIGGGETAGGGSHPPAAVFPTLATEVQRVENTSYFLATENTFIDIEGAGIAGIAPAPPFDIDDGAGLARVDFEIAAGVTGDFTFEILTGTTAATAITDGADFETPLAFGVSSPILSVVDLILGDVNGDTFVDFLDISAFIQAQTVGGDVTDPGNVADFLALVPGGCFACADVLTDLLVDFLDISTFIEILDAASASGSSALPEPATLMLMAAGSLILIRRRKDSV